MGQGKASLPSPVGRAQSLKIELSPAWNADQVRMCSLLWLTMPAHTRQPASVKGNQHSLNTSILLPSPGRGVRSADVWVITKSRVWAPRWPVCNPIFYKPLRGRGGGICLPHPLFASLSPYWPPLELLSGFCRHNLHWWTQWMGRKPGSSHWETRQNGCQHNSPAYWNIPQN